MDVKPADLQRYNPALITDYNNLVQKNAEDELKLTGKTSTTDKTNDKAYAGAVNLINTLEKNYQAAGGAQGRIGGKITSIAGQAGLNDAASTYDIERKGFTSSLRSITGNKGPFTENDYKLMAPLLADLDRNPGEASKLYDDLRKQVAAAYGKQPTTTTLLHEQAGQHAQQGPSIGGLLQNAGQDAGSTLNGILGLPKGLYDNASAINQQGGQLPNAQGNIGQAAANAATQTGALFNTAIAQPLGGLLNEANQLTGRPLEGGDILGRIGQRAYQKPVSTALDLLPLKGLTGAKGVKAADAASVATKGTGLAEKTFVAQFGLTPRIGERLKPLQVAKEVLNDGTAGSFTKMKETAATITGSNGILSKAVRNSLGRVKQRVPIPTGGAEAVLKNTSAVSNSEAAKELSNIKRIIGGDKLAQVNAHPGYTDVSQAFDSARDLQKQAAFWDGKDTALTPNPKAAKISEAYYAASDDLMNEVEKAAQKEGVIIAKDPAVIAQLKKISPNLAKKYEAAKTVKDLRAIQAPYVKLQQMIDITENNVSSKTGPLLGQQAGGLAGAGIGGITGGPLGAVLGYGLGQATQPLMNAAAQAVSRPMINTAAKLYRGGLSLPKIQAPNIHPALLNILRIQGQRQ